MASCNMNNAQKEASDSENLKRTNTITDVDAVVLKNGDIYYLSVVTEDSELRYIPEDLDESFKKENTTVIVSGEVGDISPSVRALGLPLKITSIVEDGKLMLQETTDAESTRKTADTTKRNLEPISSIEFAGSKLTVREAVTNQLGVLVEGRSADMWLIEQYKNGQVYNRLIPINLDKEFMKNGLQIEFDGHIGNPPPNVRLMGTPIQIEFMEVYEGEDLIKKVSEDYKKGATKFK